MITRDVFQFGIALHFAADVESIFSGKHDVENHEIGFFPLNGAEAIDPIHFDMEFIAGKFGLEFNQRSNVFFIFDQ